MAVNAGSADGVWRRRLPRMRDAAPLIAPLVLAAALAGAAVVTVERTGCDTPGRYMTTPAGVEYVGGCLGPLELPGRPYPANGPGGADDARKG